MSRLIYSIKKNSCTAFCGMCLAIALSVQISNAQHVKLSGSLYGETPVGSVKDEGYWQPDFREGFTGVFVATQQSVYIQEVTSTLSAPLGPLINFTVSFYSKIFTVPAGRVIKAFGAKYDGNRRIVRKLLVLLDNGDVYCGNTRSPIDFSLCGHIGTPGSESWQKILGDAIFVLSSSYLRISRDNGATWQIDSAGISTAGRIWDFDQDTTLSKLYAGTNTGGLYTKDTLPGSSWAKATSFTGTNSVFKVFIDRLNRILVAGNGSRLWKSSDNGNTWPIDTVGLGANGTLTVFGDDVYNNLYGANAGKLYKSVNGNQPWQRIDVGILSMTTNALTYTAIAGDSLLFAATNFGSFISNDQGNTWMKSDSGIVAENFYGLAKLTNNKLFASTNLAVFLRNAANQTWSKSYPQNGYSGQVPVYADNAGVLYARDNSIPHNNNTAIPIVKSTDQGATWAVDTVGLSAITGDLFYIDETGTQYYANTRFGSSFPNYIWKRTPPGPWTIDTLGFRPTTSAFNSAMASDKNGYIYISGSFGGKKVMRRPIAGGAWEVDTAGLGSSLSRFAIMTTGYRGDVIGANGNLLYHKGSPWSRINLPAGLTSANITAISVDSAGNLFIALANSSNLGRGVYRTQNFGSTWTYAGLDSMYVAQLISYNDTTYALTLGNGLFALTAPVTALPVHFISVKATQQGQAINVQWNVADEENAEKYEVERSANERNFSTVGSVPARNRGSDSYSWLDQLPNAGDNFYRIKMIERTGRALYSQVVKINSNKKQTELMVYPNPAKGFVNVQLINVETGMYKMSLYKDAGKLIFSRDIQHSGGSETITFPVQFLSRGYYVLEIKGRQTLKVKLLIL